MFPFLVSVDPSLRAAALRVGKATTKRVRKAYQTTKKQLKKLREREAPKNAISPTGTATTAIICGHSPALVAQIVTATNTPPVLPIMPVRNTAQSTDTAPKVPTGSTNHGSNDVASSSEPPVISSGQHESATPTGPSDNPNIDRNTISEELEQLASVVEQSSTFVELHDGGKLTNKEDTEGRSKENVASTAQALPQVTKNDFVSPPGLAHNSEQSTSDGLDYTWGLDPAHEPGSNYAEPGSGKETQSAGVNNTGGNLHRLDRVFKNYVEAISVKDNGNDTDSSYEPCTPLSISASANGFGNELNSIQDVHILNLMRQYPYPIHRYGNDGKYFMSYVTSGSFHRVWLVTFDNRHKRLKFAVRVDIRATIERWTSIDAWQLENSCHQSRWINKVFKKIRAPLSLAAEYAFENNLKRPFEIQECMDGASFSSEWTKAPTDGRSLEQKRLYMLDSLASVLAEFQDVQFPAAGSLWFSKSNFYAMPLIGPYYHPGDHGNDEQPYFTPCRKQYHEVLADQYAHLIESCKYRAGCEDSHLFTAAMWLSTEILRLYFPKHSPDSIDNRFEHLEKEPLTMDLLQAKKRLFSANASPGTEYFVLKHPDLNWQNILVDENFNVVGFIDWDTLSTVPAAMGSTSYPFFLWEDFHYGYFNRVDRRNGQGSTTEELKRYRKAFTESMLKHMSGGSAATDTHPRLSHVLCSIYESLKNNDCYGLTWSMAKIVSEACPQFAPKLAMKEAGDSSNQDQTIVRNGILEAVKIWLSTEGRADPPAGFQ
ncbi:hypothetical protein BT63DRAFT_456347 [Microthyrium microscopicum]|uniref:Uncharacterized protein n=1 Tax=Microthyrium microscopicum TaxID=703497 RepID=A0A6A6UB81_9PEZI|nr:hypothetical protein BT63DRAFT_456347 [Microthyrium microscopicum]